MSENKAYDVYKELRFVVCGEEFAIRSHNGEHIDIEETRKNGQEDTHMCGDLIKRDGIWDWEDRWSRQQFERYGNDGVADAILAYLNTNPIPDTF